MTLDLIHHISFDMEETILSAAITDTGEWILLVSSGNVIRYNIEKQESEYLFSVVSDPNNDFDLSATSTIYTLGDIVVLVNDYKRQGYVFYPGRYGRMSLWREDYHADITRFPIALFYNDSGVPHLIYSVAWNHLQIMDLNTKQILTAAKSLIEDGAEDKAIQFQEQYPDTENMPWPARYDYFYGPLIMAPGNKRFMSRGWVWGSSDCYTIYEIADFITNNRISSKAVRFGNHLTRPACWLSATAFAVIYIPFEDDEENATKETPAELRIYDATQSEPTITRRLIWNVFNGSFDELMYCEKLNALLAVHKEKGIVVCDMDGNVLLTDEMCRPLTSLSAIGQLITIDKRTVLVHQLTD